MLKYISFGLLLFLFVVKGTVMAQNHNLDSKFGIETGKLDNGLTYYLYDTNSGNKMANFYFLQNGGAILEDDDQNGLAHFLEHMAFKGSKNLPPKGIFKLFERRGMPTAYNAYTAKDETIYWLRNIPVADKSLVDTCLLIVHDWCKYVTFEPEQIDGERSVIIEEIRMRRDLTQRISEQSLPILLNHSKYSKRDITGDPKLIANFKRDRLVDFYEDWYHTENQAVVVVGDFDIKEMKEKIVNRFSSIPRKDNPKKRPYYLIPDNEELMFGQVKDSEIVKGSVGVSFRHKEEETNSVEESFRNSFINDIINVMLLKRVNSVVNQNPLVFNRLKMSIENSVRGYYLYSIDAAHKKNKAKEAVSLALGLNKYLLKKGFSKKELDETTDIMLRSFKNQVEKFEKFPVEFFYQKIKDHFIFGRNFDHPLTQMNMCEKLVNSIDIKEINSKFSSLNTEKNKCIIVLCNEEEDQHLTKDEILEIEKKAKYTPRKPVKKNNKKKTKKHRKSVKLLKIKPEGTPIVKEDTIVGYQAEKWILANGATVVYKYSNIREGAVNVHAYSPGGISVLSDGIDAVNGRLFNHCTECLGFWDLSDSEFSRVYANSSIKFNINLRNESEEMEGSCKLKDLELLLQTIYSEFEGMTYEQDKFVKLHQRMTSMFENSLRNYKLDLLNDISALKDNKLRPDQIGEEEIKYLSFNTVKKIREDRFADASDFTFYIVGDVERNLARELSEKYFGAISSKNRKEQYKVHKSTFPKGYKKVDLAYDMDGVTKAGNIFMLDLEREFSDEDIAGFKIIEVYLKEQMHKYLRDEKSGTYFVETSHSLSNKSLRSCRYEIKYECNPDRVDELAEGIKMKLQEISEAGISSSKLTEIQERFALFDFKPSNEYFIMSLLSEIEEGKDTRDVNKLASTAKKMKVEYINTLLKELINTSNKLDVRYMPK